MIRTIKGKFILFSIIVIIISACIPIYFLLTQFEKNFEERSEKMLDATMEIIRIGIRNAMMLGERKNIQELVKNIAANENVDQVRIFNEKGEIRYASNISEINKNISEVAPHHINFADKESRHVKLLDNESIYSNTEPIYNEIGCQSCHGTKKIIAYIDVDTDMTQAESIFYTTSNSMIVLALVVILLLVIGFYFIFTFFVNKPLKKVILAMDEVEKSNLEIGLPINRKDEMGKVFKHFNQMVSEIKSSKEKINELHFEQLQRTNRLKILGELQAQTAHEINNHMAIIMSRADYLELESKKASGLQKYREDLEVLIKEIGKVSIITSNILKHSKKSGSKIQKINLLKTVENILILIRPTIKKKQIKLEVTCVTSDTNVSADPIQIEQILLNLINNSIEAVGVDGIIEVKISRTEKDTLQMSITDNGKGIPQDVRDQIFSPFYTTKASDKGTGLGLYIVKKLCAANNAEINFSSVQGEGTSFKIMFNNTLI